MSKHLVIRMHQQLVADGVYTLDMQSQPAGVYVLLVREGREQFQFKVIKQ